MRLLLTSLIILCSLPSLAAYESKAAYAILMDHDSSQILYQKNADVRMYPASMTKIMTAYILFDAVQRGDLTLDSELPVSEKAWRKGGSKMFVKVGDKVRVEDLIRGIIVQSGNDACIVIAEALAGSEEAFADEMNRVAESLGMHGTHFVNATGWPNEDHYTTAYDLAILAQALIHRFPEYYGYYSERSFTYAGIKQYNRNTLLGKDPTVDGLKTGHTEASGYGIVSSARKDDQRLIAVVNGLDSKDARITESQRLLRHGFRDFEHLSLYRPGDVVDSLELWMGEVPAVDVTVTKPLTIIAERRLGLNPDVSLSLEYDAPIAAPVEQGQEVATLVVTADGEAKRVPLVAKEAVEQRGFFGRLWLNFLYLFTR